MQKNNLAKFALNLKNGAVKHSPEILMGIGIAGMITTTVMAVKATPKAITLLEDGALDEKKPVDVIKITWKCYIPAIITGAISVTCLIGASSVNLRRNAALATAYTLSESTLREYQKKMVETIGEKKEQAVRDAVAKERIEKSPVEKTEVFITAKGNNLCFDTVSGRYFKSDIEKLKQTINELNRQMMNDMYISLNDFYYEIGLDPIKIGADIGWNIDDGYIDLRFSSQLASDGTPCLVIDYGVAPRYDFRKLP